MSAGPRIIVALDFAEVERVYALVSRLDPKRCRLKVGKELFTHAGPAMVSELCARGFDIFLDLKFHDIPNTVARACQAAAGLGVWMVNVHASGGRKMLEAARAALLDVQRPPLLVAVTVLTSLDAQDIKEIGWQGSVEENVLRLAELAAHSGLNGVVCSPREVAILRASLGADFQLVTPGIRPAGTGMNDQSRTLTPRQALDAGANYLVIGRPITAADDPLAALTAIEVEISAGSAG
ncbi:MAG: orotidine-5'-phosphate decarboxylase [Gammaproteobacteria bacterium]|nr:orotidine-5'-phosphate decarboxylase [Gammaproteobacteria bacterium]